MVTTDSGETLTNEIINRCVTEHHSNYFKLECNDLVYSYSIKVFKGEPASFALIVNDMGSVQRDKIYRLEGDYAVEEQNRVSEIVTPEMVVNWVNQKFPEAKLTKQKLEKIAHSPFWIKLDKSSGNLITISSSELGDSEYSYEPIGKIKWTGKDYQLLR